MSASDISRRQFVILGSVAGAALASGVPLFGGEILDPRFVSVGYHPLRGRMRGVVRRPANPLTFVDATTIAAGDPRFFRNGAKLRIHDFRRAAGAPASERVDVEMLFSVPEVIEPLPFYAFSSFFRGGRPMQSKSVAFNVPVESTGTVDLAILRQSAGFEDRTVVSFSVNDGPAPAIRLIEGLYAIALLRPGQPRVDWSSVRADGVVERNVRSSVSLVQDSWDGPAPVHFDYLLVSLTRAIHADDSDIDLESTVSPDLALQE